MSARAALRAATSADHERVDALFSRFELHCAEGYGRFLSAQAAAHLPVEEALEQAGVGELIPDWPGRRRSELLKADLAELGLELPEGIAPPRFAGPGAILGAVYVLEGSRLGGSVLQREVSPDTPKRFLAAQQEPGSWRKLLARLDEFLYEPSRREGACQSAREVFARFELAGRRYLECATA